MSIARRVCKLEEASGGAGGCSPCSKPLEVVIIERPGDEQPRAARSTCPTCGRTREVLRFTLDIGSPA